MKVTIREVHPVRNRAALATIAAYFILAYAFTWACHLAIPAFHLRFALGTPSASLALYLLGLGGPLFAALILSAREGRSGLLRLFVQATRWRFSPVLYVVAFGTVGALYAVTDEVFVRRGGRIAGPWIDASGVIPLLAAQIWVVVGEKFGWRGFALPRLQPLLGRLPAAIVIGVLWAAWHLPMFFVPGAPQHGQSFWEFCYVITAWSIIMAALYNIAGASLIPTMLFHAASNGWGFVFNIPSATRPIELALYAPVVAVALVVVHGRLGRFNRLPEQGPVLE